MESIMFFVLLGLMVVCLVSSLLALASFGSSITGGHARTAFWSKIYGGTAYLSLSTMGLLSTPYLPEQGLWIRVLLSLAFGAIGFFLLRTGLKAKRAAKT